MITAGFSWNIDYGVGLIPEFWGHKEDFYKKVYLSDDNLEQYEVDQMSVILLRPKSRGTVRLRSKNPSELPLININYLSEQDDVNTLAESLATLDQIIETNAFKKYQMSPVKDTYNCGQHTMKTQAYRECYVRYL